MAKEEAELSEDLLWSDEPGPRDSDDERHQDASSEEPEAGPGPQGIKQQRGLDIAGASNASHQSSTLRASLEDELDAAGAPTPSPPVDVPGGGFRARGAGSMMPQHMQPPHHHHQPGPRAGGGGHQQYHRLGTSAPIAIPHMSAWRGGGPKGGLAGQPDAASTFIPPHQLSRQEDFTFSFTGASPSATLKRERLRARNAILRSTGFLEPQAGAAAAAAAAIPVQQPAADKGLARTSVQSSLTAALTTIGES